MRLIFYLKHFPPDGKELVRGTTKAVHGLVSGCAHAGAKVTIICEGDHRSSDVSDSGYGIECFRQQSGLRQFSVSKEMKNWISDCEKEAVFVLNGMFHPRLTALKRVLKKTGRPYIIATHGDYHPASFHKHALRKHVYWHAFERPLLQGAAAIQVLDQRHQRNLSRRGVTGPFLVSPNGCFPVEVQRSPMTAGRRTRMLLFGRLDIYHKGIDLLLGALQIILRRHDVDLTIQGPEHDPREKINRLILEAGLRDRARCLAPEYDLPPSDVMSQYDMVVMPSRFEGFGLSALEAMVAERVVLITTEAGIAPHVEKSKCGVVIDPTIDGIIKGLEDLISRKNSWKSMGSSGRRYALKELTWERIGEETLAGYRSVLGSVENQKKSTT